MGKRRGKHLPPSRKRYEDNHPVIAIRVDRELHSQLLQWREKSGQSWGDILRVGLGLQKPARLPDEAKTPPSWASLGFKSIDDQTARRRELAAALERLGLGSVQEKQAWLKERGVEDTRNLHLVILRRLTSEARKGLL